MSICLLSLLLGVSSVHSDEGPVDELGCHQSQEKTEYHCHAGPLAGARYANRAAAEKALAAREHAKPAKRSAHDPLNVVTWSFDGVPKDAERVAGALGRADLTVLRGLSGTAKDTFLTKLIASLDARTHQRHCRGSQGDQTFVWREDDVGVIKPDGALIEACAQRAHDLNSPGAAVFVMRASNHVFTVGQTAQGWPALVYDAKFPNADKLGFKSAFRAAPAAAWTRALYVLEARLSTLRELYPDLNARDLDTRVGRYAPTTLQLSFSEPDAVTLQMVKRGERGKREIASEPAYDTYPATVNSNNLSLPEDDLESEERASRPKSPVRAKKNRKRR